MIACADLQNKIRKEKKKVTTHRLELETLLGSLLPFCLGGDAKSIVLTNQRTPIQNASPNSEREPKFGYASPHSDVPAVRYLCLIFLSVSASSRHFAWLSQYSE